MKHSEIHLDRSHTLEYVTPLRHRECAGQLELFTEENLLAELAEQAKTVESVLTDELRKEVSRAAQPGIGRRLRRGWGKSTEVAKKRTEGKAYKAARRLLPPFCISSPAWLTWTQDKARTA